MLSGRSVCRPISSSESSPKNRNETTSRYGSGSAATAFRMSAARSARIAMVAGSKIVPVVSPGIARSERAEASDDPSGSIHVDGLALPDTPQRDANGDPRQPRAERPVATPARERAIRGHEGLLGDVLRLVQVAEDPMACAHDRSRLAVDQVTKRLPVAGEDGIDDRALRAVTVGPRGGGWSNDRLAP